MKVEDFKISRTLYKEKWFEPRIKELAQWFLHERHRELPELTENGNIPFKAIPNFGNDPHEWFLEIGARVVVNDLIRDLNVNDGKRLAPSVWTKKHQQIKRQIEKLVYQKKRVFGEFGFERNVDFYKDKTFY